MHKNPHFTNRREFLRALGATTAVVAACATGAAVLAPSGLAGDSSKRNRKRFANASGKKRRSDRQMVSYKVVFGPADA